MLFVLRQDRLERPNRSQIPPSHRTTRTASRPAVPVPHPRLRCVSTQRHITALNQDFKGPRFNQASSMRRCLLEVALSERTAEGSFSAAFAVGWTDGAAQPVAARAIAATLSVR